MGYTVVKSFERGLDTRRLIDTTEAGALLEARDCHITLGGEIEKRAAYITAAILPANTVGLWVTEGRIFHTWGNTLPAPALPPNTIYHYVPNPSPGGGNIQAILSVEEFNSGLYTVIQYEGDPPSAHHWWWTTPGNDILVRIPENDPVEGGGTPPTTSPGNKPQASLRFALITAGGVPVSNVTIQGVYLIAPGSSYNWGVDAWLVVTQSGTSGTWPISSFVVTAPNDPAQIAAKVMSEVNSFVPPATLPAPVVVKAQASDASVQFWLESPGPTYNGWQIKILLNGPARCIPDSTVAFSGGTPGGTALLRHSPVLLIDAPGDPIQKGTFARAHNERMFSVQGTLLNYSAPGNAQLWAKPSALSGDIDHSKLTANAPHLVSMGDYGGNLAVFGKRHIFVWHIGEIPEEDRKLQTLHGTGTSSPHSVVPYGQSDVMYLDISGVRSLRARDSSEQAFAADIGNLIDNLVRAKIDALTEDQRRFNIWGIVEPRSGRLWMALHNKIFVLSFYPSSSIAAWSWYDATSAPVDYMCTSDESVYWRSGNTVYIYGGEDGDEYDDTQALARIPYIDGGKPATHKNWTGIDLALSGRWQIRGSFDPMTPTALDLLANLDKSTYAQQKVAINGESPALSLELQTPIGWFGRARIGNAALHFSDSNAD